MGPLSLESRQPQIKCFGKDLILFKENSHVYCITFSNIPGGMGEKVLSEKLHFRKDKISQSYLQILEPVVFSRYAFG